MRSSTGFDPDYHCSHNSGLSSTRGSSDACDFFVHAVPYARSGAPDPSKPVLLLDRGNLQLKDSMDAVFGDTVPTQVVDPRSDEFATLPLDTAHYSAIIVASDNKCGGCDLNESGSTPDSDAISARKGDIRAFFDAGGGVIALSGGELDYDANTRGGPRIIIDNNQCDTYYAFLPLAAPACAADNGNTPATSEQGATLGFQDGSFDGVHNGFADPASDSPLRPLATQPADDPSASGVRGVLAPSRVVALFGSGPDAVTNPATGVTLSTATLNGSVNPEFGATTYRFQFGTTTAYGANVPAPDAAVGSDRTDHPEGQGVSGLAPATTYHFRIAATNAAGTTYGVDQTFATPAAPAVTAAPSVTPAQPAAVRCVVPKLKGKTIAQARSILRARHCTLGKIVRAHTARSSKGKVVSQSLRVGGSHAAGTRVSVRLTVRRARAVMPHFTG